MAVNPFLFAPPPGSYWDMQINRLINNQTTIINMLSTQHESQNTTMQNNRQCQEQQFRIVNQNLCAVTCQPPRMATPGQRAANLAERGFTEVYRNGRKRVVRMADSVDTRPAKCAKIKTVGQCWIEFSEGIGGRKPTRLWSPTETGACCTYSRRFPIYEKLKKLTNILNSSAAAIACIDKHYRNWPLLKIAEDLRKREKDGTLPQELQTD